MNIFTRSTRKPLVRQKPITRTRNFMMTLLVVSACFATAGLASAEAGSQNGGALSPSPSTGSSAKPAVTFRILRAHVRSGSVVRLRGRKSQTGRLSVAIRRKGQHNWHHSRQASVADNGRFRSSIRVRRPGIYLVRVKLGTHVRIRRLYAYVSGQASWYGPGLYGNRTACGQRLNTTIVGVAHRTLPCGSKVKLRYGHRTVTVRVIDRGPFAAGRTWDLTAATKRKLGFPSTGSVLSTR